MQVPLMGQYKYIVNSFTIKFVDAMQDVGVRIVGSQSGDVWD